MRTSFAAPAARLSLFGFLGFLLVGSGCETRRYEVMGNPIGTGGSGGNAGNGGLQDAPSPFPDGIFNPPPDMSGNDSGMPPDACTPVTCQAGNGRFCGRIGDGCGAALECGECPDGQICGGAGMPHVCAPPPGTICTPITCTQATGRFCAAASVTAAAGCSIAAPAPPARPAAPAALPTCARPTPAPPARR